MRTHGRTATLAMLLVVSTGAAGCGSGGGASNERRASPATVASREVPAPRDAPGAKSRASAAAQARERERSSESSHTPVATVGDRAITLGTVRHWVAIDTRERAGAPEPPEYTACIENMASPATNIAPGARERFKRACAREYDEIAKTTLDSLIHADWLIAEAAEAGLNVGVAAARSDPASTISRLSTELYRKLEREVPAISRARASSYYARHERSYFTPESRDLYILRMPSDAAAKQARQEIEHGTGSFAAVAEKASLEQPVSAHRGLLLGLGPDQFAERPLNRAIFGAPLHTLSEPVPITSFGYYLFEVIRRAPARQRSLAEVEPEIVGQLRRLSRDRIVSSFVAAFRRKWTSKTSCADGYVVSRCRQYRPVGAGSREASNAL